MKVQMEVSLYPFGVKEISPPIMAFVETLQKEGFETEVGPLSSYVTGESEALFPALGRAFEQVAKKHRCVLVTKVVRWASPSTPNNNQ